MIYIGIDVLAANALIALLSKDPRKRFVRFAQIHRYGIEVVRILSEKKERAVLMFSKESTSAMFSDYSDYFTIFRDEEGWRGVKLQDGVSAESLKVRFLAFLPSELASALADKEAVDVLTSAEEVA